MPAGVEITHAALKRLTEIALAAGESAMRFYHSDLVVDFKGDASPVTAADRTAHTTIVRALTRWDGTIPIVSEEGDLPSYEQRQGWPRFWLVDPLDGTKEFIARNGEFTVNVALIEEGVPVLGVIVAPAFKTVYVAGRALGAWSMREGVAPERIFSGRRTSGVVRVVESRSHPSARLESFVASLGATERILLGSSLKFCRVAEGSADLYPRFGPAMEWDVAAGDCIYRNSGPVDRPLRSGLAYNTPSCMVQEFVVGADQLNADVQRSL